MYSPRFRTENGQALNWRPDPPIRRIDELDRAGAESGVSQLVEDLGLMIADGGEDPGRRRLLDGAFFLNDGPIRARDSGTKMAIGFLRIGNRGIAKLH